jgi:hypothetical protein
MLENTIISNREFIGVYTVPFSNPNKNPCLRDAVRQGTLFQYFQKMDNLTLLFLNLFLQ